MAVSDKELLGALTGVLVLGCLRKGSSYGYELVKRLNEEAEGLLEWKEGTLYPVLHRLEEEGLVKTRWLDAEGKPAKKGERRRKYYALTGAGRKAMEKGAKKWGALSKVVRRVAGV